MTQRRWWRPLRRWVVFLVMLYLGAMILIASLERKYIFMPTSASAGWLTPPAGVEDVNLSLATGETVHAWFLPRPGATRAMLYCHGSGGNVSYYNISKWSEALDASVMIFDYPGYGKSTGLPSELGCQAAGEAAFAHLRDVRGYSEDHIVVTGLSLGGAVAVELACHHTSEALVIVRSFTSMPDMAQQRFPWLPARYLVRTQFNSLAKIPQVRCPVFVAHGTADEVVPFAQGERLYAAVTSRKQFFREDGSHGSKLPAEFYAQLRAFLDRPQP